MAEEEEDDTLSDEDIEGALEEYEEQTNPAGQTHTIALSGGMGVSLGNFDSWTIPSTRQANIGDIYFYETKGAICIYDGESWKPLIRTEDLKIIYENFKKEYEKNDSKWMRFLTLELGEEEESLPDSFKNEAFIQMFRLKMYKMIQDIKKKKK